MKLLYPNAMLSPKEADDIYNDEYIAAKEAGLQVALFSREGLQMGKRLPQLVKGDSVLYRGWMMTPTEYTGLCEQIIQSGGVPLVSPDQYELCHYLPSWLPRLSEFTAETVVFPETADVAGELRAFGWNACFLKDYVKSLQDASLITDLSRIPDVIAKMKRFRGQIEGGLCARKIEDYDHSSERRYFVFRGIPRSSSGEVPEIVHEVARRIDSPFYSVDVIKRRDGVMRIVEIGDGQVSDLKGWTLQNFMRIFA